MKYQTWLGERVVYNHQLLACLLRKTQDWWLSDRILCTSTNQLATWLNSASKNPFADYSDLFLPGRSHMMQVVRCPFNAKCRGMRTHEYLEHTNTWCESWCTVMDHEVQHWSVSSTGVVSLSLVIARCTMAFGPAIRFVSSRSYGHRTDEATSCRYLLGSEYRCIMYIK